MYVCVSVCVREVMRLPLQLNELVESCHNWPPFAACCALICQLPQPRLHNCRVALSTTATKTKTKTTTTIASGDASIKAT